MLSVCISHSLSSGILPGLVLIVWTIDKMRTKDRKEKTPRRRVP